MDSATTPAPVTAEAAPTPPIDLEATPEFAAFKAAQLVDVATYLDSNWGIKNAELVMMPPYVFPDRENRKAYASVATGRAFRDADNKVIVNPATGQPMTYTVWRKIEPPAPVPELAIE
ncbi:hypothetical protein, partial [Microcoleus sp. SVA1B1]|uniref:hypothetical protein n=1 Tax=Microcoleus sp. SVA1B1 TaxID=3055422 RepID=UPI002FD0C18F